MTSIFVLACFVSSLIFFYLILSPINSTSQRHFFRIMLVLSPKYFRSVSLSWVVVYLLFTRDEFEGSPCGFTFFVSIVPRFMVFPCFNNLLGFQLENMSILILLLLAFDLTWDYPCLFPKFWKQKFVSNFFWSRVYGLCFVIFKVIP